VLQTLLEGQAPVAHREGESWALQILPVEVPGRILGVPGVRRLARSFQNLAQAMVWLRQHPGIAVGTVVLVAGVAYIVSTGGAGALILLPAA
jgi:hypothetical protein